MNNTTSTVSEYKIGHTTYIVKTVFNPDFRESLTDILNRLITRECENLLGDRLSFARLQEQDKQAV